MKDNLYTIEYVKNILEREERSGRLRLSSYSDEIKELSKQLKIQRQSYKRNCNETEGALLDQLRQEYSAKKEIAQKEIYARVIKADSLLVSESKAKGKAIYMANANPESAVVARIVADEISRSYRLKPANRDEIIEQLRCLLDNTLPKIIIRGDVHHFYESIPQDTLMDKLRSDGYLSSRTLKNMRILMYQYNCLSHNTERVGLPRGISFSAYLSEVYLRKVDVDISRIPGVYFYKRYVDDIIVIANPMLTEVNSLWNKIRTRYEEVGLSLHEDSKKCILKVLDSNTEHFVMDYLGYQFRYHKGQLEIGISERRYRKYQHLIDAIFSIYQACSHYRSHKDHANKSTPKQDALNELFNRLFVLTGNGRLSSRKSYVSTGVHYTNKLITDLRQLRELDLYLADKIENSFNPPRTLFHYNGKDHYDECVAGIKQKLHSYSFCKGYSKPNTRHRLNYAKVVTDLQKIYSSVDEKMDSIIAL